MRRASLVLALSFVLLAGAVRAEDRAPRQPAPGPGLVAWFDITSSDLAASQAFYGKLFGWTFGVIEGTDLAVEIVNDGTAIGTLRVAEGALSPFDGVVYVQVGDVKASCTRVKQLGGTIAPGFPWDLPGGRGAIALLLDPSGHPLGMFSPTPMDPAGAAQGAQGQ